MHPSRDALVHYGTTFGTNVANLVTLPSEGRAFVVLLVANHNKQAVDLLAFTLSIFGSIMAIAGFGFVASEVDVWDD